MYCTRNNTKRARAERLAIATIWCSSVVIANLTAAWFVPVAGVQIAVGTLAFGLTFTIRDHMHAAGRRFVYATIASGTMLSALAALATGVPLRIIAASCVAILIAESADTELFQALWQRSWLVRALSSNAVSIPLDTFLFTLLAFGGVLASRDMWQLVIGDTVLKFLIGGVLAWTLRR